MAGYPAIEAFPDHGAVPTRRPGRKPCSATQGAPSHARGGMAQAVLPETSETRSAHGAKASGVEARWGETPPATSCPARKRRPARPLAPAPTLHISEPIWGTSTLPAQCPRAPGRQAGHPLACPASGCPPSRGESLSAQTLGRHISSASTRSARYSFTFASMPLAGCQATLANPSDNALDSRNAIQQPHIRLSMDVSSHSSSNTHHAALLTHHTRSTTNIM